MEVISIGSEEEGVKESDDALLDTEDEIVAKDISIFSGIEAAPFDVSVYKHTRVRVSLDNIVVPPNTALDLDPSHAANIGRDLVKYGPVKNIGDMAVVAKETPPNFNPTEDEKLQMRVYITDGRHRRKAYLYAQERGEQCKEACKSIRVSMWTRGDGKPVSFIEWLAISTFLNQ